MTALLAFPLAALLAAPPPATPKLAVLDVRAQAGVPANVADTVTSATTAAIRTRATEYTVIGLDEIRSLLALEKQKQQVGCQDTGCLAELGGDLGAREIVTGTLGRLGETYLLTLRRVDVRHAQVLREATARITTDKPEALLAAVDQLTSRLFGIADESLFVEPQGDVEIGAPSRSHVLAFTLIGVAIAAAAVGAVSTGEVVSFQSTSSSAQNAINAHQLSPTTAAALMAQQHQAQTVWQPLAIVGFVAAGLAVGGAVIAW